MLFRNRSDAGRQLARQLNRYAGQADALVMALPRGGVPVGHEVARLLGLPLDVFLVRKLGIPGHEELAMGAIASGGIRILNTRAIAGLHLGPDLIDRVTERELRELQRRERAYRNRPAPDVRGKTVILVDDGLATGSTMRAAVTALRQGEPGRIVVAVPVGATDTCEELRTEADEVVCLHEPDPFRAVGAWYEDFTQTTDEDVCRLLREYRG